MKKDVNILSNKIGWFGKYSGYECLPNYFPEYVKPIIHYSKKNLFNKVIGKFYKTVNKIKGVGPEEVLAEVKFIRKMSKKKVSHILYLEGHVHILPKLNKHYQTLIGTIHIPFSDWKAPDLESLKSLKNAIILYQEDVDKFSSYIPLQNIHVIRFGVDIDFFRPGPAGKIIKNKVLLVGHFLRNFPMFFNVYRTLNETIKGLEFHIIIPGWLRQDFPELAELAKKKNVFFHENLSDEELLEQYQNSYVLLMPMSNSGVSTAIVQAIATGLPIITTDVGGIRSYGGGDVFPLVSNNDDPGMTELFRKYYFDEAFRNRISSDQRKFAVEKLDWNLISQEHVDLYKRIAEN